LFLVVFFLLVCFKLDSKFIAFLPSITGLWKILIQEVGYSSQGIAAFPHERCVDRSKTISLNV